jgi:hypothetical protein
MSGHAQRPHQCLQGALGTWSHGDGANAGLERGALAHRVAAWIFEQLYVASADPMLRNCGMVLLIAAPTNLWPR